MEDNSAIVDSQSPAFFEKGNFYNESEPFKRGSNEYVYRSRVEEISPGLYNVYVFEFKSGTWEATDGRSTASPVDLMTVEKIHHSLKLSKILHFDVVDFTDNSQENQAEKTKEKKDDLLPTPERQASSIKEDSIKNPFHNKPDASPDKRAGQISEKNNGIDKTNHPNPESRAQGNKEADSDSVIFAKSVIKTVALGAAGIAGLGLLGIVSPFVAGGVAFGLGAKAILDGFTNHGNSALDKGQDPYSYDTVSAAVSNALPFDIRSAIAVAHGFDPTSGDEMNSHEQAMASGNVVGSAALILSGTAAAGASKAAQSLKANRTRKYLDEKISATQLQKRQTLLQQTKDWAKDLPQKDRKIANKIINEHEKGTMYGLRNENGTLLILDHHSQTSTALKTLKNLFPAKAFNVRNKQGRGYQGAHLNPASYMKQIIGYKSKEAIVSILPTKFRGSHHNMEHWAPDVHRRMDAVWKMASMEKKAKGQNTITAAELLNLNIEAIQNAPHLSPTAKMELISVSTQEFMKLTNGNMGFVFKIPNILSY